MLASTKIYKVVVAVTDSDPRNNGKGLQILRNSGVKVKTGVGALEVGSFIKQHLGKS